MRREVTCVTDTKKKQVAYWKGFLKQTEVTIWREFSIYSDADKKLYVELNLDMRRGICSVGKKKIAILPLEVVMKNNNMLTPDELIKIEFGWVDILIYDEELEVDLNVGEMRGFCALTEKDVSQICSAVEIICEY